MPTSTKIIKSGPDRCFGSFIKQKRIASGLTLDEVAAYLQINVDVLVRYEESRKTIPLHHIYALSNCLNISADLVLKRIETLKNSS